MKKGKPRKRILGVNDLATTHPDLAAQAHEWDPSTVTQGSGLKKMWKCGNGHLWEARVQHRAGGIGCPICSNQTAKADFNSLLYLHPDIAKDADGWDPSQYVSGSGVKKLWKCSEGHSFYMRINARVRGNKCNVCVGREVLSGFNDLRSKCPEIAEEADGWDTSKIFYQSQKRMNWICKEKHRWSASVRQRVYLQSGCPYCAGRHAIQGVSDLLTTHPNIAKEAHNWDPQKYKAGSQQKLEWKCHIGHIFLATPNDRTRKIQPSSCPYCSGRRTLAGFNDLATTHPLVASQANGWDPTKVSKGVVKKLPWKCPKGHEWVNSPNQVVGNKVACPVCSNAEIRIYINDLATSHPELAKEAFGWDPTKIGKGNSRILKWQCSLGHIWNASVINRTIHNSGCPVCAGQKVWRGFNDLATKDPNLALEADGWDPSNILAGGSTKRKWKCAEGHNWNASIQNRMLGTGCPSCSKFGFDPNKNAVLYLMRHEVWQLLQIGITNNASNRVTLHEQRGWKLLDIWGPADGLLIKNWETSILQFLKQKKVDMANQSPNFKFDGYTEAWSIASFDVEKLQVLMDLARDF